MNTGSQQLDFLISVFSRQGTGATIRKIREITGLRGVEDIGLENAMLKRIIKDSVLYRRY
jgi:hypothetical protein